MNRAVIKPGFDFSEVKTVRVGHFSKDKIYHKADYAVQTVFIQQLLAKGYNVVSDVNMKVDAVIEGSITDFRHERTDVVYGGWGFRDDVAYDRRYYNDGFYDRGYGGFGVNRIYKNAVVGISAYMTDVKTGQVVWSDSCTNEGSNLEVALGGAVKSILKTLPQEEVFVKQK
jgi:hypothetical protein